MNLTAKQLDQLRIDIGASVPTRITSMHVVNTDGIIGTVGTDKTVPRSAGAADTNTVEPTGVIIDDSDNIDTTGVYMVSGTPVVGAQQSAITNPSTSTSDLQTAVIAILDALRAHGLIAT